MNKTKFRIYCVDDDSDVRVAIKRLLESEGLKIETFSSTRIFLDSVALDSKGCLILDLCMPEMGGFALQKKLNELGSRLQVIFITGQVSSGDREHAIEAGAAGFLLKPFDDESLLELIRNEIEKDKNGN